MLFHPVHRKFIKKLRSYADKGTIINVTDSDRGRISELFHRTNNAHERHTSIYKLILEILNRNTPPEDGYPFTHEMVDFIENRFARAERSKPWMTFLGTVIIPLLQFLNKRCFMAENND